MPLPGQHHGDPRHRGKVRRIGRPDDDDAVRLCPQRDVLAAEVGPRRELDDRLGAACEHAHEAHDDALMQALVDAGFCDLEENGAGPLEAVLVTEAVAAAAGRVLIGPRALVAPALLERPLPPVICLLASGWPMVPLIW